MHIGISTSCFFPDLMTEETLPVIASLGVTDVEWFMQAASEYALGFSQAARADMDRWGLRTYSLHAMTTQFEPQLFSPAPRQRADAWAVLDTVLCAGKTMGARTYSFHGMANAKHSPGPHHITEEMLSTTRALVERCATHGMLLAWENVYWAGFRHPSFAETLRREVAGIHFTLDLKQALVVGEDPFDYLQAMGDAVCNVHVCDVDANGQHCLPGRGVFDFPRLGRMLQDIGYQGGVMLEVYADNFAIPQELGDAWMWLGETLRG